MPDFETICLLNLIKNFNSELDLVATNRNLSAFLNLSPRLQNIYNYQLTSRNEWKDISEELKSLFSSFNYAAVIINDATKKHSLDKESTQMLWECIEIMQMCCKKIIAKLSV